MAFHKIGNNLHIWKSTFKPTAQSGKHRVPWKPGLRLTGILPRCLKSDGAKEDTRWGGFPWVESLEDSSGREEFGFSDLKDIVFRTPCDLVFLGHRFDGWSGLKPLKFSIPKGASWPLSCTDKGQLTLSVPKVELIDRLGKLRGVKSSSSGLSVHAENLTRSEYESIGYRLVSCDLPPVQILSNAGEWGIWFPFLHAEDAVGVNVLRVYFADVDAFSAGSIIVESPDIASRHTPWLGFLPKGTKVEVDSFSASYGMRACVRFPISHLCHGLITKDVIYTNETVLIKPEDISPDMVLPIIECTAYGDGLCFLAKDDSGLVPFRSLLKFDTSSLKKRRLWRYGKSKPDEGAFYCLKSETENLPLIDHKAAATALALLRNEFPWAEKKHLENSREEMLGHAEYLVAVGLGWKPFIWSNENDSARSLYGIANRFFSDDKEVFIQSPITKTDTLYRRPSYEKIASNEKALSDYLTLLIKEVPLFAEIASDPEIPDRVSMHLLAA